MRCPVKISLIVPVYNVEAYLPKCLESCLNQTLYDLEIICVNDGSTDTSGEILAYYAGQDPRIRVITKPNGGLASARNAGMDIANGWQIMFLDADDLLVEYACERVWRESQEESTDIVIFGTEIFPDYPECSAWHRSVLYTRTRRFYHFEPDVLFSEPGAKPFIWRQAFSRGLLERTGVRFHEEMRFGEDLPFQFEIFPHANNFAFIADRLYQYRWIRENSLMHQANQDLDNKIAQHLQMAESIARYWDDHGFMEKYRVHFFAWLLDFFACDLNDHKLKYRGLHVKTLFTLMEKYDLIQLSDALNAKDQALWQMVKRSQKETM